MLGKGNKKITVGLFLLLGIPVFLILFFLMMCSYSFYKYRKIASIPTTALIIDVIIGEDVALETNRVYERSHPIYCPTIQFTDYDNKIHETTVVEYYCSTQPIYNIGDTLPIFRADRQGIAVRVPHIHSNEYLRYIQVTALYELLDTFGINLF